MTETSATADAGNAQPGRSGTGTEAALARIRFTDAGLAPAIVQQWDTGEVLMLGWMDAEAFRRTMAEGRVTFWSRSRQEHWRKGDTSGHAQYVKGVALDCDGDTLLVTVDQVGAACHTGTRTCFDADRFAPIVGARPRPDAPSADAASAGTAQIGMPEPDPEDQ